MSYLSENLGLSKVTGVYSVDNFLILNQEPKSAVNPVYINLKFSQKETDFQA
jgi:hypothetical protein